MKVEKRKSNNERRIITAMIVDRHVLSRIANRWDNELFNNRWSNLIGSWCVDFLKRYDKAPKEAIETLFETWSEKTRDEATVNLVSDFLSSLSNEYEALAKEINTEYILDLAGHHFNKVRLEKTIEEVQNDLSDNRLAQAEKKINNWGRIELGGGEDINVLNDMEAIREAFDSKSESLLDFPGALGQFFGTSLERDGFIAFMSPDKRGKSFWLSEIAYRGILNRRRVAFFECGDMSRNQILRRIMTRIAHHPERPSKFKYPTKIEHTRGEIIAEVETKNQRFKTGLSWQHAWKKTERFVRRKLRTKKPLWRLSVHPNSTVSVAGIRDTLSNWEREEWVPDIVIIDYADILAPIDSKLDERGRINDTWKAMRAMSQSLHCLVVTASQTDSSAYKQNIITRSNFSDDKRKLAHVTGMIGLNQTLEEKETNLMRLNWVVRRSARFSEMRCVHVASCLELGNPAVRSCW